MAVRTVLTCAAETEGPADGPPPASAGSGQLDAVCLRALPPNPRLGATCACELLFERLPDKVHQADLLGHAVQSQLSVQRFRNPGRKLHPDEFFPPSHAQPSCRLLHTTPHNLTVVLAPRRRTANHGAQASRERSWRSASAGLVESSAGYRLRATAE